ncbi:MAG TPA: PHB depolymerase family esterase [Anaeromyxobacteraceae bacterium]|nr:PHB depolymerase family esterase [Anaeromyxobacteraceae bacterium]
MDRVPGPATLAALCAALLLACGHAPRWGDPKDLVASRPYRVLVPPSYARGRPAPLVVLLHGYGSSGAAQLAYFGFAQLSAARGVLVAYPDGSLDRAGRRFWNAADVYGSDVDDVAYLSAVLDDLEARYDVDRGRVFLVGHSNGAFMAQRMACELSTRVRGVVALAGDAWMGAPRCKPSAPVPVLQVHGDADKVIPYGGGLALVTEVAVPSAPQSIATWAAWNGCSGGLAATGEPPLDLDARVPGAETRRERWSCSAGAAELWTMEGGGHVPALRVPAFGDVALDWLQAHAR